MNPHFIRTSKKREIIGELNKQFGISEIPLLLIESGKDKIRGFSGHLSKEEISQLSRIANLEGIGLYLMKKERDWRLTIDATHLFREQITKNIIDISEEELKDWLRGRDLEKETSQTETVIIRYKGNFIGCGKSNGKKIFNYIPKERRLKN